MALAEWRARDGRGGGQNCEEANRGDSEGLSRGTAVHGTGHDRDRVKTLGVFSNQETSQKSQTWFKSAEFRRLNFAELIYSEVSFSFYTGSTRRRQPRTSAIEKAISARHIAWAIRRPREMVLVSFQLWHSSYRGRFPTAIDNRWILVVGPIHPQGDVELACRSWQPIGCLIFARGVLLEVKIY